MEFRTPTTKAQMMQTLQDIFHFYRIERQGFVPAVLTPLNISKLEKTPVTGSEFRSKAYTAVYSAHTKETLKKTEETQLKISVLTEERASLLETTASEKNAVAEMYTESEEKVRNEAVKKGISNSSIVLDKLAELERAKNDKIADVESKKNEKLNRISAEISALNSRLSSLVESYDDIFEEEIIAKTNELIEKDKALERDIIKYNNTVEEKLTANANNIETTNANLQLKFMEITSNFFTKDQLIEMGYYDDVMTCLNAYYGTMSPRQALNDIVSTGKLAIYLDDYYQNYVYTYTVLAQNS